ncbi:unnamed protein product [[Candida] boidinii]|nr:unnamed protein product [[Candida] boidinii]
MSSISEFPSLAWPLFPSVFGIESKRFNSRAVLKVKKDLMHNLKFEVDNGIFNCCFIESGISNRLISDLGNEILLPLWAFKILECFDCIFERECVGSSDMYMDMYMDMNMDMNMNMDIDAVAITR